GRPSTSSAGSTSRAGTSFRTVDMREPATAPRSRRAAGRLLRPARSARGGVRRGGSGAGAVRPDGGAPRCPGRGELGGGGAGPRAGGRPATSGRV
ncbi:MAG: hypothetical protein AVDCRST_MAG25-2797, partial [uncultured Rubrobacteraceae bacterium]